MTYPTKNKNSERPRKTDLTTLVYGKIPPQCPEFEEAVLAAVMLESESMDIVVDIIKSEQVFYVDAHQKIYEAILALYNSGSPIDLLTVTEQLRKFNNLELIGGGYYLTKLTMAVMSSAHIEIHARIITEKFMQREMIRISGAVIGEAYEDSTDVFDLIDKAEAEISNLTNNIVKKEPVPLSKGIHTTRREIEEQSHSENEFTGVPTGFYALNKRTGGWQKQNVIILAARPSVGKTAFAINLLISAAKAGFPGVLFSLEMSAVEIHKRMLGAESGVECQRINNPNTLSANEKTRLDQATKTLSEVKIFIDDTAAINSVELRAKARKLKTKYNIQLIIIDYLQLMEVVDGKGKSREQVVSFNSREIKKLAKSLDIPIIALSQLNRALDSDKGRLPRLSDLRESGAIEQDADLAIFLSAASEGDTILVDVAKGRNTGTEQIAVNFTKEIQKFSDVGSQPFQPQYDKPSAGINNSRQLPPESFWNEPTN